MLPLVKAAGANRFKDLLLEATFRLSDTVTGSSRAYAAIDKKLRDTNAFNCLPRTERLLGILFPDCRIIYRPPFLYNIHDRLINILGKPASKLHPSDVIYDIYLLPKGESGRKPSPDSVGFHILQHSADFALEQVSSGVLHIRDTLNNHFRIIISSAQEYSSYMYGQISNGLPLSEQHDIYDSDIPENKKIVVRAQEDQ